METVGDGSRWGVSITYLPQDAPRGLAHGVVIARDFLGDDDFVMYLGDNMLQQGLKPSSSTPVRGGARATPRQRLAACSQLADPPRPAWSPIPQSLRCRGARRPTARWCSSTREAGQDPPSDLAIVGVYLFDTHDPRPRCAEIQPSARGELEITDAIQWLVDHGAIGFGHEQSCSGWWIDTGKKDAPAREPTASLLETHRTPRCDGHRRRIGRALEGRVVIEAGADHRELHGARTGRSSGRARGSSPTASSDRSASVAAELRDHPTPRSSTRVLLERSRVIDVPRLEDSLVGRDADVTRTSA